MGWRGSEHITELMSLSIAGDLDQTVLKSALQLKQFYSMTTNALLHTGRPISLTLGGGRGGDSVRSTLFSNYKLRLS